MHLTIYKCRSQEFDDVVVKLASSINFGNLLISSIRRTSSTSMGQSVTEKGQDPSIQNVENAIAGSTTTVTMPQDLLDPEANVGSYGRDGIMGLFDSWFVFGAAFLASLGGFSFGRFYG